MPNYKQFAKTLAELRKIGESVPSILVPDRPYEVDIERIIEEKYGIAIDIAPLKAEKGVEGYPAIGGTKIFIDIGLADADHLERRYRFTLAEELAHVILHKDIYKEVRTLEDYFALWESIPEEEYFRLDKNAKELAGIILMPEKAFLDRMRVIRNALLESRGIQTPDEEQKSVLTYAIQRQLARDFNVSTEPCGIRLERVLKWHNKTLFDI